MVKRDIDPKIIQIAEQYAEVLKQYYDIDSVILFGSYAKGKQSSDSDIDIAVVSKNITDEYNERLKLMEHRRKIDYRIEPHAFKTSDFESDATPLISEIIRTGIKIA